MYSCKRKGWIDMNISNALRILIRDEKKATQKEFAESIDMPFTTLNTSLRVGNITINKLLKILNALDYEIVLRPKRGVDKNARSIVIDEMVEKR